MIFGTQTGKVVNEGDLLEKFFENYNILKRHKGVNIGWELINKYFYED